MKEQNVFDYRPVYTDFDPSGFMHYSRLMVAAEEGRIALMASNYVTIELASEWGYRIATFSAGIKLTGPVRLGDMLQVRTEIVHLNRFSIKTASELLTFRPEKGKTVEWVAIGTCECVNVFLDTENRPKVLPEEVWQGRFEGMETVEQWGKSLC